VPVIHVATPRSLQQRQIYCTPGAFCGAGGRP